MPARSASLSGRRRALSKPLALALAFLAASTVALGGLTASGRAGADTLQMSADNLQTGWYPNEPGLAPSAVAGGGIQELFSDTVSGNVYGQPLVYTPPSTGRPTLLVATEENEVYGLDPATGAQLWSRSFGPPWQPSTISCGDLTPNMGITGTPVVDPATGIAYFVADVANPASTPPGQAEYFMDAVDVATGATPPGWPAGGVPITGSADGYPSEVFNPEMQAQRPGLVLVNGVVYAAFGSHCDIAPWQGWLVGVSTSTASVTTMWSSEIGSGLFEGGGGGIWQSGSAPVVDAQGDIYVSTGNGVSPSPGLGTQNPEPVNYAEAVVKLSTTGGKLHVLDWFVPWDAKSLNKQDGDLGSGGPVALPASMGSPQEPNVLVQIGKEGMVYALNMDHLGGYQACGPTCDSIPSESGPYGGMWSKPAVWPGEGGYIYIAADGSTSFSANGGQLDVFKRMVSASGAVYLEYVGSSAGYTPFTFGTGSPVVTSNGTTPGSALVWLVAQTAAGPFLEAYDALPQDPGPNGSLTQAFSPQKISALSTFAEPGVDGNRLYIGTMDGHVDAYGISSPPPVTGDNVDFPNTVVAQPTTETATFTATAPTTVESFAVTGTGYALGALPALPQSLTTGQTISVPVTFTPQ
ncbi:MAG TPA: hypothetical protein VND23_02220, partial [Acidimicrobiales bacterium]|nr:hypothetical protein [Acidimicrobiales bacterium]